MKEKFDSRIFHFPQNYFTREEESLLENGHNHSNMLLKRIYKLPN
jgi:hypothetical protein